MRLHAFLLLALFAIVAQSATIPEKVDTQSEKKIDIVSAEKIPAEENYQENIINDVDNKLRLKPADIPVKVVVENVNPALKVNAENNESEEIIRQPIDLNNPGVPQRQEHDSQSPEAETAEFGLVEIYKKEINEAQAILKQGFNSIQNMFEKKDNVDVIHNGIETFKKTFVEQINKINGTVLSYLNSENGASPAEQQTKAHLEHLKSGLNTLKSEFTKGMNTLADGVVVFSSLKADGEETPSPPSWPWANWQQQLISFLPNWPSGPTTEAPTGEVQADTEDNGSSTSSSWFNWPDSSGPFGPGNAFASFFNTIVQAFPPSQSPDPLKPDPVTEDKPSTQTGTDSKPDGEKPSESAAGANQVEKTTLGPIRQILQNNPITQGIVSAIQNLQNINKPVQAKDPEKATEETASVDDKNKGGFPGRPGPYPAAAGHNNNISSGIEQSEQPNVPQETLPEAQEPQKEEDKEHKTEVVADKTE